MIKPVHPHYDVAVIGAGPVGLFAVFELGLLGLNAIVVDVLDRPGGQCTELYPDKPIYDIPAYPKIGAQELVDRLMEQIKPFSPTFMLERMVESVTPLAAAQDDTDTKKWRVTTSEGESFTCCAIFIAAGTGTFTPRRLRLPEAERFENVSLFYAVRDKRQFTGCDVVIAGGGDSALDWTLELLNVANSIHLVHRRDRFRAAPAMVEGMREAVSQGRMRLVIGDIAALRGSAAKLDTVVVSSAQGEQAIAADRLLAFYGLQIKLGPVANWGLELYQKRQIVVDTEKFQTNIEGIFAIGDINWYPGKLKLILSGFHEAALAAHAAFLLARPGEKLRFQYTTSSSQLQQRLNVHQTETISEAS